MDLLHGTNSLFLSLSMPGVATDTSQAVGRVTACTQALVTPRNYIRYSIAWMQEVVFGRHAPCFGLW